MVSNLIFPSSAPGTISFHMYSLFVSQKTQIHQNFNFVNFVHSKIRADWGVGALQLLRGKYPFIIVCQSIIG